MRVLKVNNYVMPLRNTIVDFCSQQEFLLTWQVSAFNVEGRAKQIILKIFIP